MRDIELVYIFRKVANYFIPSSVVPIVMFVDYANVNPKTINIVAVLTDD